MLSIGNMYERLNQYTERDDYYTRENGQWNGRGADRLGLSGELKADQFSNVRQGVDPTTGERLVPLDNAGNHRDGYDLTFSAGKDFSMLREFGGEHIREAIDRAWDQSIDTTMAHLESRFIAVRETHNHETEVKPTGEITYAKFHHEVSRELDPQKHTHCPVMNISYNPDTAKHQAVDGRVLYDSKMYLGQYQRNEFAANLKEEFHKIGININIQPDEKGLINTGIFSKAEKDHFSQRSEQIKGKMDGIRDKYPGATEAQLKEFACLGSRSQKDINVNMDNVRDSWKERAESLGINEHTIQKRIETLQEKAQESEQSRTEPKMNEYDYINTSMKALGEQESVVTREDVLQTAGKLSAGEYRIGDLDRALNELSKDGVIKDLGQKKDDIGMKRDCFTTPEITKKEGEIDKAFREGHDKAQPIISPQKGLESLKAYETTHNIKLTTDQEHGARHILESPDRYLGIQGDAGTGKTTMLGAVREISEKEGHDVRGLSFTGKAAEELQAGAGIKSQTVDSFLMSKESGNTGGLWVVDEASMMGTRHTHALMERAQASGARIVFVGDTKQNPAVAAGKPFAKGQERSSLRTVEMHENVRQKDKDYKEAVKAFSGKKFDKAMQKLESRGRIHEIANREDRLSQIVKDYSAREKPTIIITARNNDRNEFNARIRENFKAHGKLKGPEHKFTVREPKGTSPVDKHFAQSYKEGDIIYNRKAGEIGRAGRESRVTGQDEKKHTLTVVGKDGKEQTVDLKKYGANISAHHEKVLGFSEGDRIAFMKNDKGIGVKNGTTGILKSCDEKGNMKVTTDKGNDVKFNINSQYNYIDHGYAVTNCKSQGQTSREVIINADTSKGVDYHQTYVGMTRGKDDLQIYTDNKDKFAKDMKEEHSKTSTLDHDKPEKSMLEKSEKGLDKGDDKLTDSMSDKLKDTNTEKSHSNEQGNSDDRAASNLRVATQAAELEMSQ